jgi:anti-anti-sigma factor
MVLSVSPPDTGVPLVSRDGDRIVVWLDGEHDIATVPVLIDTLTDAISAHDADLIVDLSGVTFMGVATIGALISGRNLLRQQSHSLSVRSPSKCARRVLNLCGLTGLIRPDPVEAPPVPRSLKAV